MADPKQLELAAKGVAIWNKWRKENQQAEFDLSGANLRGVNLSGAMLSGCDLRKANLTGAILIGADLSGANLKGADLSGAKLGGTNLTGANLSQAILVGSDLRQADLTEAILVESALTRSILFKANLSKANLSKANLLQGNLRGANLTEANLYQAYLVEANLTGADLTKANIDEANLLGATLSSANLTEAILSGSILVSSNFSDANLTKADLFAASMVFTNISRANMSNCRIYGLSVWDIEGTPQNQENLVITKPGQAEVTVDNLEVAQFIYLLLKNEKLKNIIDTITSKAVLILGRFTKERKVVLDAIRDELRKQNFTPILFDFDKPASKDLTGTVETLARMARFIIADVTDPSSIPHELATIIPSLRTTPVLPIRLQGSGGYTMFKDFQRDLPHRVLETYEYKDSPSLIDALQQVIAPVNERAESLRSRL